MKSEKMSVIDETKEIISLTERAKQATGEEKLALLDSIEKANMRLMADLGGKKPFYRKAIDVPPIVQKKGKKTVPAPMPTAEELDDIPLPQESARETFEEGVALSASKKKKLLRELHVDEDTLKRLYKKKGKKKNIDPDYTIYVSSSFAALANSLFKETVEKLEKKYPDFFKNLFHTVQASGMNILSKSYASIMLLITSFTAVMSFFLLLIGFLLSEVNIIITFFSITVLSILAAAVTFVLLYAYPSAEANSKARAIENDLPFAIIHMAAVAGSGAQPIVMFRLLLNSHEYKGLEKELKRIVNYVNLFGYDLSTALKSVSLTTPSQKLKDLLTGIASTIESGGGLKSYLNSMAEDTMTTYKLDRKKYVEVLATYSDIYTGVLIAAPLLFMVTLAIINLLGGNIAGVPLSIVAGVGTYVALPLLNVMFLIFLHLTQPGA